MWKPIILFISSFVWIATIWAETNNQPLKPITFAGSSTIMPIMMNLQSVFRKHGIKLVVQGGGSSAGIKSVKLKMALMGMVSRSLTSSELKMNHKYTFAKDLIVLIVNQRNPISQIDSKTVVDIYSGKQKTWINDHEITVIAKERGRATRRVFDQYFQLSGKVVRKAIVIGPNGQAIATVASDNNAIAYVSLAAASASISQGESIKILMLNGVIPSIITAQDGHYKLVRDLNLIYLKQSQKKTQEVINILTTSEAKTIIAKHRILPI